MIFKSKTKTRVAAYLMLILIMWTSEWSHTNNKFWKKENSKKGEHPEAYLGFWMKPVLSVIGASWSDAGDVERLPGSHRLFTGFNFHLEILHLLGLCRTTRDVRFSQEPTNWWLHNSHSLFRGAASDLTLAYPHLLQCRWHLWRSGPSQWSHTGTAQERSLQ